MFINTRFLIYDPVSYSLCLFIVRSSDRYRRASEWTNERTNDDDDNVDDDEETHVAVHHIQYTSMVSANRKDVFKTLFSARCILCLKNEEEEKNESNSGSYQTVCLSASYQIDYITSTNGWQETFSLNLMVSIFGLVYNADTHIREHMRTD